MSEDRMVILDRLERGELSVAEAQAALRGEATPVTVAEPGVTEEVQPIERPSPAVTRPVVTRR